MSKVVGKIIVLMAWKITMGSMDFSMTLSHVLHQGGSR
ncbi:hypothetical protein SAMN05192559_10269 [Halobacillus karajensis]|uniref:Uncharacterized protein n=1 Tax=Halobacillus karajensis TaxID=195088 RepID=A0A024P857_9BACI|nr:hypothetical protein BN982_00439 [Halobacillus karajensis]CDQ24537.1 hypothetical protein BN983_02825 [Halobacillus karajensis]CDQ29216.1 hypothetical protein BN981_03583 [Halobacillus karajensis]SEH57648.1 hypothetical protein SAMN05192559_10269 [Halobacillus karajensis]